MELSQNDSNSNNNNNQVCSYLGGQLENYCIEFLAEYTDDIIDMLVKGHKQMTRIMWCTNKIMVKWLTILYRWTSIWIQTRFARPLLLVPSHQLSNKWIEFEKVVYWLNKKEKDLFLKLISDICGSFWCKQTPPDKKDTRQLSSAFLALASSCSCCSVSSSFDQLQLQLLRLLHLLCQL